MWPVLPGGDLGSGSISPVLLLRWDLSPRQVSSLPVPLAPTSGGHGVPWPNLPLILKTNGPAQVRPPFPVVELWADPPTELVCCETGRRATPLWGTPRGGEREAAATEHTAPRKALPPALSSSALLPAFSPPCWFLGPQGRGCLQPLQQPSSCSRIFSSF